MRPSIAMIVLLVGGVWTNSASAQWDVFENPDVSSQCGVVNTGGEQTGLEFVVRSCDGALVLVTGDDVGFANTYVTLDGVVEIDGEFAGYVEYYEDADGYFTLWWVNEDGRVMDFDDVTYQPYETEYYPDEYSNVPCEAEELWGGDADCDEPFGQETMLPAELPEDQPGGVGSETSDLADLCGSGLNLTLIFGGGVLPLLCLGYRRRRRE